MKICYVATVVEMPYEGGVTSGGATHAYEVARGLVERGHAVYLLCCRGKAQPKTEEIDGVFVNRIFNHPGRLYFILRRYPAVWMLLKLPYYFFRHMSKAVPLAVFLARTHCDIVYERCTIATAMHSLVYILLRRPLFLEINDYHDPVSGRIARSMVVPNRMAVPHAYRHKVNELSWGANIETFKPRPDTHNLRSKYSLGAKKVILIVCSGVPWHGLSDVITAAGKISPESSDIVFMVVGGGDHFLPYTDRVRSLGLDKRFVFTGAVEYKKVPEYMAAADIAIAPYTSELKNDRLNRDIFASPIKVFEYMACGKPIVITQVANANKIIEHMRTGFIIREDSPEELADAILYLLSNEKLRFDLGRNARTAAEKNFSWQAHVGELEKMFISGCKKAGKDWRSA